MVYGFFSKKPRPPPLAPGIRESRGQLKRSNPGGGIEPSSAGEVMSEIHVSHSTKQFIWCDEAKSCTQTIWSWFTKERILRLQMLKFAFDNTGPGLSLISPARRMHRTVKLCMLDNLLRGTRETRRDPIRQLLRRANSWVAVSPYWSALRSIGDPAERMKPRNKKHRQRAGGRTRAGREQGMKQSGMSNLPVYVRVTATSGRG